MRGKKSRKRFDAAGLRLAAGDPENVVEAGQRLRRRIGIGGLGIVDEQNGAAPADFLHAVREPRERAQACLDRRGLEAERQRGGRGAGGILRIVQAAQRADAAKLGDRNCVPPLPARMICSPSTKKPSVSFCRTEMRTTCLPDCAEPLGDRAGTMRRRRRRSRCRPSARRRRGVLSPRRSAPSCRDGRDDLR